MPPSAPSRRLILAVMAAASLAACGPRPAPERPLTVFAAASLGDVMEEAARRHEAETGRPVRVVAAGSAQLARQIDQGAPADLFVPADAEWMDWLAQRGRIDAAARRDIAANQLVLVAPATDPAPLDLTPAAVRARLGDGRLATAEPEVPAGRYGREALTALGLWPVVEARLAPAENVRAALALAARGEAPLAVVYATDARAEPRVRVVAAFPAGSHTPIVYPAAPVQGGDAAGARAFLDALTGEAGQARLRDHGFAPPPG